MPDSIISTSSRTHRDIGRPRKSKTTQPASTRSTTGLAPDSVQNSGQKPQSKSKLTDAEQNYYRELDAGAPAHRYDPRNIAADVLGKDPGDFKKMEKADATRVLNELETNKKLVDAKFTTINEHVTKERIFSVGNAGKIRPMEKKARRLAEKSVALDEAMRILQKRSMGKWGRLCNNQGFGMVLLPTAFSLLSFLPMLFSYFSKNNNGQGGGS